MDQLISSLTLVDIVIILVTMGMFVAGWLGGAIRQLLQIAALLVSFLLASNLRDPLGAFLAHNWTWYDPEFNYMLALLGLWLVFAATLLVGIQLFYRRVIIHERLALADEVVGGLLGASTVLLVLALLSMVLSTYYGLGAPANDATWARGLNGALDDSAVMTELRRGFVPGFVALMRPLLPADLRDLFA